LEIWDAETYRTYQLQMQVKAKEASKKLGPVHFFPKEGQV
jgi:DNA-binding transcriptional regulator/RsmH inhibitor MraZ